MWNLRVICVCQQGFAERDDSESDDSSSGSESQPAAYQAATTSDMTSDPTSMQLPAANPLPMISQNRASINFISDANVPDFSGSSDESSDESR